MYIVYIYLCLSRFFNCIVYDLSKARDLNSKYFLGGQGCTYEEFTKKTVSIKLFVLKWEQDRIRTVSLCMEITLDSDRVWSGDILLSIYIYFIYGSTWLFRLWEELCEVEITAFMFKAADSDFFAWIQKSGDRAFVQVIILVKCMVYTLYIYWIW